MKIAGYLKPFSEFCYTAPVYIEDQQYYFHLVDHKFNIIGFEAISELKNFIKSNLNIEVDIQIGDKGFIVVNIHNRTSVFKLESEKLIKVLKEINNSNLELHKETVKLYSDVYSSSEIVEGALQFLNRKSEKENRIKTNNLGDSFITSSAAIVAAAEPISRYGFHNLRSTEICNNILEAVGNTPMVYLKNLSNLLETNIYAKVEYLNPGLSSKDRIAVKAIQMAEEAGKLKPGGIVIESSSGNTGFSLAIACNVIGYDCILCIPDKSSKEKISALKAIGARVIVCPANVKPEDPLSYISQAKSLHQLTANSIYINQYFNNAITAAHYNTTGPEIWSQSGGEVTHYLAAASTGGTLTGTAKYLKEMNPKVKVIGVDAEGSVLKGYFDKKAVSQEDFQPYLLEEVGNSFIPGNLNIDVIDQFVGVNDRDSAFRARQLAKREGIFAGYSSGAVIQALFQIKDQLKESDMVVALLPDHGSKYLSNIYNNNWMHKQGFIKSISEYTSLSKIQIRLEKVLKRYGLKQR